MLVTFVVSFVYGQENVGSIQNLAERLGNFRTFVTIFEFPRKSFENLRLKNSINTPKGFNFFACVQMVLLYPANRDLLQRHEERDERENLSFVSFFMVM